MGKITFKTLTKEYLKNLSTISKNYLKAVVNFYPIDFMKRELKIIRNIKILNCILFIMLIFTMFHKESWLFLIFFIFFTRYVQFGLMEIANNHSELSYLTYLSFWIGVVMEFTFILGFMERLIDKLPVLF